MKILHLMPYCPVPPVFGGALRTYHLLRNMTSRHDVTAVTFGTEADRKRMVEVFGPGLRKVVMVEKDWLRQHHRLGQIAATLTGQSSFRFISHQREIQRAIDRVLEWDRFDIIQTEFPMMGSFKLESDAARIVDEHNVEYENFRRMYVNSRSLLRKAHYYLESVKMYREEIDSCRRQDALFVTSLRDKEILDADLPGVPKYVIPNGVDMEYFRRDDAPPDPHSIVFSGMMGYVPNYDGMMYFLDSIFPRILRDLPDTRIMIVGMQPPKELRARASDRVVITGFVDDVRPYLSRASLYVVPLRMGSGTRLKILEAMSMRVPIVTTSIGCEGIAVTHGESLFIEDDPACFAERAIQILRDGELRRRLVSKGYELVRTRYDWSIIGQSVDIAYRHILHDRQKGERGGKAAEYLNLLQGKKTTPPADASGSRDVVMGEG